MLGFTKNNEISQKKTPILEIDFSISLRATKQTESSIQLPQSSNRSPGGSKGY